MAAIERIAAGALNIPSVSTPAPIDAPDADGFSNALSALVNGAEDAAGGANKAVVGMLNKSVDVHDAMIAVQRAEMSLQLAVQIRNKLVNAYNDIMRMSI